MKRMIFMAVWILALLATAVTSAAVSPRSTAATSATNSYMTAFPLPWPTSQPLHIVVESPTKAWFTLPGADAIASLTITSTVDYAFAPYPVTAASEPYDLALAGDYVWFTLRAANQIGRLHKATGVIDYYNVPTAASAPTGIDVAPGGMVWFAQESSNKFGRLDPSDGTIDEFLYQPSSAGPPNAGLHDLVVQNDNIIRGTAPNVQRVVAYVITQSGASFLEESTATTNSQAQYMALSGNVTYISAENSNLVGRYAPGTLSIWRWYTPYTVGSGLADIGVNVYGGVNRIWVAQRNINSVLMIETTSGGAPTFMWEQSLPFPNSQPTGLAVASDGAIWVTAPGSNEIVTWLPPYLDLQKAYLPLVVR
jgi:streptogramin lyase